jgi:hypothetical protein
MKRIGLLVVGLMCVGRIAVAQDVGTVAAVEGSAEIKRSGTATAAVVGAGVRTGDELRTVDGKMRVVFQDDSVIDLGERSALVVDEQVFNPSGGQASTLMNLVIGKARAAVSHYYGTAGTSFEVRTPTAVAGVRGTEFLISYDAERDVSEVVGIHGFVQVRNLTADVDEFIYVGAEETTHVQRDMAPTSPQRIEERMFRDEVQGLELLSFVGAGTLAASSLSAAVAPPEQAPSAGNQIGQLGRDQLRNIADVVGQPLRGDRGRLGVPF